MVIARCRAGYVMLVRTILLLQSTIDPSYFLCYYQHRYEGSIILYVLVAISLKAHTCSAYCIIVDGINSQGNGTSNCKLKLAENSKELTFIEKIYIEGSREVGLL